MYPGGLTVENLYAEELMDSFGLEVVFIPTHRMCVGVDHPDLVFVHYEAKNTAWVREIDSVHAHGHTILVGTASVSESENLAASLAFGGVESGPELNLGRTLEVES